MKVNTVVPMMVGYSVHRTGMFDDEPWQNDQQLGSVDVQTIGDVPATQTAGVLEVGVC
jgi:hypothetical protein